MSYLMQLALAVTRAIDPKRLYDWMIAVTKAIEGSASLSGVGPYDTVARVVVGGDRMLDAPAGPLALIENGSEVWVESFGGSTWVWRNDFPAATATDNITTCRPTAWIAGGLDGAFVRELQGTRLAQAQAAWFVNSTAADNEGAGSSLDPLKTDEEIQRRWGPDPSISVQTVISYAQSPATLTNLKATLLTGGSITLLGVQTVDRNDVALTAVTAQNRTTQTPLAVTGAGLGAADVGKLAVIVQSGTPANVGAYAAILKDQGAGSVMVGKFGTSTVALPFTEVTPVAGDIIDVVSLTQLSIGHVEFTVAGQTLAQASPTRNCVLFDSIRCDGSSVSLLGTILSTNCKIFFQRSILQNLNYSGVGVVSFSIDVCGGLVTNVLGNCNARFRKTAFTGGGINLSGPLPFCQFDADCYFENAPLQLNTGSVCNTQGVGFFDRSVSDQTLFAFGGATIRQSGAVADWGTANTGHGLSLRGASTYTYATKPNINGGLGAGREANVGGTDKLYADVPYIEGANNANLSLTV